MANLSECGHVFRTDRYESCPICEAIEREFADSDFQPQEVIQLLPENVPDSNTMALILSELKRQSVMLRTITRILVAFSAIAGFWALLWAISLASS